MKNIEIKKSFYLIILIFLISNLLFSGCLDNQIIYDYVEIREYQGEKLSSINAATDASKYAKARATADARSTER